MKAGRGRTGGAASAALLAALLAAPARAQNANAGTSGSTFMKLGIGDPRAQALGNAYVALAEGADAMVWNPAGVATAHSREVVFSIMSWVQDYSAKYVGYVQPVGRTVVGANFAYASISGFDVRDSNGIPLDNSQTIVRNGFATLTVARSFFLEKLYLGASVKGIYQDTVDAKDTNFVGDFGVLFRPNSKLSLGAALQNVLNSPDRVVQTRRLGVAYSPLSFLTLSLEESNSSDSGDTLGVGAELILPQELLQVGEFNFRIGYFGRDYLGQGFDSSLQVLGVDLSRDSGLSFGVGLYTTQLLGYTVGLDYAYLPLGALGSASQWLFRFGF